MATIERLTIGQDLSWRAIGKDAKLNFLRITGQAVQESAPKQRWSLDRSGLERLLDVFHPDREQASLAYEALRQRLIRFFEWNHADMPQELADETLDRLARRLSASEDEILHPAKFAAGIARLLLKEHFREKDRREAALAIMAESYPEPAKLEIESAQQIERMAALEQCLQAIPVASRNLIERYFSAEGRAQIQQRQRLAEEHGISTNALRNRVLRIRMELQTSLLLLLSGKTPPGREINREKLSQYDEQ
ncbi:MAG: RNA polymerase sigma factor [Acidobacteriaceae bacterium]